MFAALLIALAATGDAPAENPNQFVYCDISDLTGSDLTKPEEARTAWDALHFAASLQGIVNRDAPRLFYRFMPDPDDFWLEELTREGNWLGAYERVDHTGDLLDLATRFGKAIKGVVVYDERVPATSNLASTIAGLEDRVCLRYDPDPTSLYSRVMASGAPFTADVLRLMAEDGSPLFAGKGTIPGTEIPSTGSAKCDAYVWARTRYLDAGQCSAAYLAFYIDAYWLRAPQISGLDNCTLSNHDYYIANRVFFFDLHTWGDEAPVDDPGQPLGADLTEFRNILASMERNAGGKIFQIGGFTPWAWKYTEEGIAGGGHGAVSTEWETARVASPYGAVLDADALGLSGMANASFYQHFPLKDHYPQNPRPTEADLRAAGHLDADGAVAEKVYICFYMGDYDAAAWFNRHVPKWWQDPAHGAIPCAWAFNPNLDQRAPHAMDYVRTHQTANDWFTFGDCGAGYLNPGGLGSDKLETWVEHNLPYARRYDLSIVGFVIDGHSPGMGSEGFDAYQRFAPDGMVGQKVPKAALHNGVLPITRMALDLHGSPEEAGKLVSTLAGVNAPKFIYIRTILKSPSWHKGVMETARGIDPIITFVGPYTFFDLYKRTLQNEARKPRVLTEASFTPPAGKKGLAPVAVGDGPYGYAEDGLLHQSAANSTTYLYFEAHDDFLASMGDDGRDLVVEVELLDTAKGKLGIHYNTAATPYAGGPEVSLDGRGAWRTVRFALPKARFVHGQNSGADFRLVNPGLDLRVRAVRVK